MSPTSSPTSSEPPKDARRDARGGSSGLQSERLDFARFGGMGLQFAATLCVFAFLGYWLDGWLGTLPIFLIVGVFVGFFGGTFSMVKRVARYRDSSEG
jgi:ATP synthase protein I